MHRSKNYICTVPNTPEGQRRVRDLRRMMPITVHSRLGRNSPHRGRYTSTCPYGRSDIVRKGRHYAFPDRLISKQDIHPDHAERFDLYHRPPRRS